MKPAKSKRIRKIQTAALCLLLTACIINYLDRGALSIANLEITREFGLSAVQMGYLLSAFSLSYAFAQLPLGILLDKVGSRLMLGIGLLFWSIAQMCGGLVSSFNALFGTRLVLGVFEAPQFPAGAKSIGEWYNIKERGAPMGTLNAGASIAPAIAPPLLTFLMLSFGWRLMFVILGVAGTLVAILWLVLYRNRDSVQLTAEETAALDEGSPAASPDKPTLKEWLGLFEYGTTWGIVIGYMGVVYMVWLYLTWLPAFFEHEYHLSIARTGIVVAIPYLFAIAGTIVAGFVADALARHGYDIVKTRKWQCALSLIGAGLFTIPASQASDLSLAVAYFCGAQFCLTFASGSGWILVTSVIPARQISSLGSIQNFGGYLAGSAAPILTGYIVQSTGSFKMALTVSVVVAFLSALGYVFLVNRPIAKRS